MSKDSKILDVAAGTGMVGQKVSIVDPEGLGVLGEILNQDAGRMVSAQHSRSDDRGSRLTAATQ